MSPSIGVRSSFNGIELAGELQDVEKNSHICTGDRPQTINELIPAGVKDCIGGMCGEEMRKKGEGEETREVNIVSFGNCTFIPQREELNKILLTQKLMHKKDKIILSNGDDQYIGQTIEGKEVTVSGLIAAYHLVGNDTMHKALSGQISWEKAKDGNQVSGLTYMEEMGGLNLDGILRGIGQ